MKRFSKVNGKYISMDKMCHACLCATLYPDCSYERFFERKERDPRDYREQCSCLFSTCTVIGTFLIWPFYLVFKMPYLFACCIFEAGCPSNSLCAWFIAFWMCLLGFIADAFWLPVAIVMTLLWLCLMIVEAFKWCCIKKKKEIDGPVPVNGGFTDLENGDALPDQQQP